MCPYRLVSRAIVNNFSIVVHIGQIGLPLAIVAMGSSDLQNPMALER